MANTSSRTLRLLSLLQAQRYWPGADLADRLEVSVRTLRRDIERLRELGYPVEAARGVDGGYQLAAGAALPPLALDDEEAVALAVGLHAATSSAVAGMAEPSLRALTKIVQVMPPRLRRRVESLRDMTVSGHWGAADAGPEPLVLLAVAQACRDSEGLTMSYTAAEGARTERTIEPYRLVSLGRRWYLVAYDLDRHDWRTFRLDRIAQVTPDGRRFRPRALPDPDAAEFVRRQIIQAPTSYDVTVLAHCSAAQATQRLGRRAVIEPVTDESCRVSMSTDNLDWAVLTLGTVDAELSAVEPPELQHLLKEWSLRFLRAVDR